ncbi:hypothetical protein CAUPRSCDRAFT_12401 [Caulochytrium protostelioides]|nr:hypothetical protein CAUPRSCDRAFT_12401 [Caulochytrium protostelioides]
MTQVVSTRTEPPGTVLQEEGKLGKELFMIRKGKVHVQLWSQRHQRAVRVLTLGPLDYFNHNMVLDVEATASATFVVDEAEPAVVLVMTMYDARSKCLTGIPEDAPNYGWTASQIDAAYATQVEQKHWLALRQKEFHERAKRKAIAQPIHG